MLYTKDADTQNSDYSEAAGVSSPWPSWKLWRQLLELIIFDISCSAAQSAFWLDIHWEEFRRGGLIAELYVVCGTGKPRLSGLPSYPGPPDRVDPFPCQP